MGDVESPCETTTPWHTWRFLLFEKHNDYDTGDKFSLHFAN